MPSAWPGTHEATNRGPIQDQLARGDLPAVPSRRFANPGTFGEAPFAHRRMEMAREADAMGALVRVWGVAENNEAIELALRPHLLPELVRRWPPVGLARHDSPSGAVLLSRGLSNDWVIIPDLEESGDHPPAMAWDQLEQTMTAFAVQRLSHLVAVHAATIAWKGRALVVPAASGSGKSTLSLAAIDAGADVLSDEYALIDPATGRVTGWRRPIDALGSDGSLTRRDVAVDSEPLPAGLLAFIEFRTGSRNEWRPMAGAEAVSELLAGCVTAPLRPIESMDAALLVAQSAPAIKGTRGEATDAVRELLAMLE